MSGDGIYDTPLPYKFMPRLLGYGYGYCIVDLDGPTNTKKTVEGYMLHTSQMGYGIGARN